MQDAPRLVPERPSERDPAVARTLAAHAFLLGERLDLRGFEPVQPLAVTPLAVRAGAAGNAVLFRYGIVVTFNLDDIERRALLDALADRVAEPIPVIESEQFQIIVQADAEDQIDPAGRIVVKEMTTPRLQIIADILAKHLVLSHYEASIASVFDRLEPLAGSLQRTGRAGSNPGVPLQHLGGAVLIQQRMVGRVEVTEKPEALWENPDLERFYARLESEYELRDRGRALDRKLDLVFRTSETLLRLIENRRALRVEWYIVALIVFEILISLYTLFAAR